MSKDKRIEAIRNESPEIAEAISADGAIRCIDGRYSSGFVGKAELENCINRGLLVVHLYGDDEVGFAVLPEKE